MVSISVSPFTVNGEAGVVPNITLVAPVKPVPVMTTALPPLGGPENGEMPYTIGSGNATTTPTIANKKKIAIKHILVNGTGWVSFSGFDFIEVLTAIISPKSFTFER